MTTWHSLLSQPVDIPRDNQVQELHEFLNGAGLPTGGFVVDTQGRRLNRIGAAGTPGINYRIVLEFVEV